MEIWPEAPPTQISPLVLDEYIADVPLPALEWYSLFAPHTLVHTHMGYYKSLRSVGLKSLLQLAFTFTRLVSREYLVECLHRESLKSISLMFL